MPDQLAALLTLLADRNLLSRVTSLELRDGGVSIGLIASAPARTPAQVDLDDAKREEGSRNRDEKYHYGAAPRIARGGT